MFQIKRSHKKSGDYSPYPNQVNLLTLGKEIVFNYNLIRIFILGLSYC